MRRSAVPFALDAFWAERVRFGLLLAFLAACFLWGGASRLNVPGLMFLQPGIVLLTAAALLLPGPVRFNAIRVPLVLLGAFAFVMVLQLVPLPPSMWAGLPGHQKFADLASAMGVDGVWRPISLTPDLTLASLAGLVTPACALLLFAAQPVERTYRLLPYLIGAVVLSALLGAAQVAGGVNSSFYRYDVVSRGDAVGFFANRNHQAVLLAICFPLLGVWAGLRSRDPRRQSFRRWSSLAIGLFLVPMLAITGSRAGIVLGAIGLGFAVVTYHAARESGSARLSRVERIGVAVAVLVGFGFIGATVLRSRAEAFERLFSIGLGDESRARFLPVLVDMTGDFFPVGSGFGSFDPVYRSYEPFELLSPRYLNHAHNDLLELAITGGLPALIVAVLFLVWFWKVTFRSLRSRRGDKAVQFAKLGAAMIVLMLTSSLFDYPLRTPLLAALFAIACAWMASSEAERVESSSKSALP